MFQRVCREVVGTGTKSRICQTTAPLSCGLCGVVCSQEPPQGQSAAKQTWTARCYGRCGHARGEARRLRRAQAERAGGAHIICCAADESGEHESIRLRPFKTNTKGKGGEGGSRTSSCHDRTGDGAIFNAARGLDAFCGEVTRVGNNLLLRRTRGGGSG